MANTSENKYYLKTVHEDIDLYDRKLAHLMKYETFATEADRNAAARKLNLKRELLVKTAKRLVADGMEFSEKDLPRSMRPAEPSPEEAAPVAAVEATVEAEKPAAAGNRSTRRNASAFPANALGWTLPSSEAKA
ncbi:hypothetical protein SAMN05421819_3448 [Bryocella elongata]|uniref:Uncharacterized protein n=1 Tax=Bryocella elongata TaxID=863522 RepID=A0A1H6B2S1_9BACT|nr:hypothetical protein [Bryocella elongata]SEG54844.1 hypothetical protein SAMN05421819_3448 [Bryocella elongata]